MTTFACSGEVVHISSLALLKVRLDDHLSSVLMRTADVETWPSWSAYGGYGAYAGRICG